MMKKRLAITTVSLIRTPKEEKIVLKAIKHLSRLNVPLIIVDGGSSTKQKEKIKSFPNVTLFEEEGLMNQLKTSLKEGAKVADSLFYLHTDKLDFVKNYAQKLISYYLTLNRHTMLIPTRTTSSLKTYPEYQRKAEEYLNFILSDYLGKKEDYYCGPKIFSSKLISHLDKVKGEINWGIEAYFYALNHRLSLPMKFYEIGITAPKEVLTNEEEIKKYRLKIIQWQIEGLIQGQTVRL